MMPLPLRFAFLISAFGQNYIRVDSPADALSYTIDLDAAAVQRALRPVTDAVIAAKLPNRLYPGPDFKPSKQAQQAPRNTTGDRRLSCLRHGHEAHHSRWQDTRRAEMATGRSLRQA